MSFSIGKKIRKQFGGDIDITYLVKDGIIQVCPEKNNEGCSNVCPFFTFDIKSQRLKISCRPKTMDIVIDGIYEANEC